MVNSRIVLRIENHTITLYLSCAFISTHGALHICRHQDTQHYRSPDIIHIDVTD